MEKIKKYKKIILEILEENASEGYANFDAENEIVADEKNDRYQLVTMGWEGYKRVHACTLHFDIKDGKIWIQNDQTDYGIVNDLMERGVPKSDIVLAYHDQGISKELGFAVA